MTIDNHSPDRRSFLIAAASTATVAAAPSIALSRSGGSFDVVIVGGGSAGAALANRLSQDSSRRVLLIEAGRSYPSGEYPASLRDQSKVGANADHDWGYSAEPGVLGRPLPVPRGKVLGGSSAVNGAVAVRSIKADHDRWARQNGLEHWSHADVLPAYRSLERTGSGDDALHGRDGPFPIHQLGMEEVSDMQRAFIGSARAAGFPLTPDFNGGSPFGVSPYPMNTRMGDRLNTGIAYLTPAVRARKNLSIRPDTLVDSLIIEKGRAVGVKLASGEKIVGGETVLSAGTYGSPSILLRSGIGPAAASGSLGIPIIADLPVGQRLQDHPFYFTIWAARADRVGLVTPPVGAILWARSSQAAPEDIDLNISAVHYGDPKTSPTGAIFMLAVANTRPLSTGSVKLRSLDPSAAPFIDLGFLRERRDRECLIDGIQMAQRIASTGPLSELIHSELGPNTRDRKELDVALTGPGLDTYHHPTSTVPMGGESDPFAVVDWQGRVRGVTGLRVADASIFPDVPSVATNVPTLMVAERIAGFIAS